MSRLFNSAAVHHQPKSQYAYAYDSSTVHIRIRIDLKDVAATILIRWGDKYKTSTFSTSKLSLLTSDRTHAYFQASLVPPFKRLAYDFFIFPSDSCEAFHFSEVGIVAISSSFDLQIREHEVFKIDNMFQFPYIHTVDILTPPSWVKSAIFYQIFPDRFFRSLKSPLASRSWTVNGSDVIGALDFFGGDLAGISEKLPYLKDLGINALYLTPIFTSPSIHRYNTTNYFTIDHRLGDLSDYITLLRSAHNLGIKVVLDAVFNHCGSEMKEFQEAYRIFKKNKESRLLDQGLEFYPLLDWFHFTDDELEYERFSFVETMPKLNTSNPQVQEHLFRMVRKFTQPDVTNPTLLLDGWRLDVANEVDHAFWRIFRSEVKKLNPEAYILGEIWHSSTAWLMGDQFDGVMNYNASRAIIECIVDPKSSFSASELAHRHALIQVAYPEQALYAMFNSLGTHDTERIVTRASPLYDPTVQVYRTSRAENEPDAPAHGLTSEFVSMLGKIRSPTEIDRMRALLGFVFLYTYIGTPCIFQGDEFGISGAKDPDCRRPLQWDSMTPDNIEFFKTIKALITLRLNNSALHGNGCLSFLQNVQELDDVGNIVSDSLTSQKFIAYERTSPDQSFLVTINPTSESCKLKIAKKTKVQYVCVEPMACKECKIQQQSVSDVTVELSGLGFVILVAPL
ncbi:hypothetical protein RCL1_000417 [Eukaryota sp. TZLM3-RCL]